MVFTVKGLPIKQVAQFKYLGRVLDEDEDDNHAAPWQLKQAKDKWGQLSAALKLQGADTRARGYFYKAVVQAVLLYGSESWTLTESTLKLFRSFHSRVARLLTGRHICHPKMELGFALRRGRYLKQRDWRPLTSTSSGEGILFGVLSGRDRYMRLVDKVNLCQLTHRRWFGGDYSNT